MSRLTLMRWTSFGQCLVLDDDSESDERAVDFVSLSRWATSFRSHHNFSFASKLFFFQMKNEVLLVSLNNIQRFWRKLIAFFKYFVWIDASSFCVCFPMIVLLLFLVFICIFFMIENTGVHFGGFFVFVFSSFLYFMPLVLGQVN